MLRERFCEERERLIGRSVAGLVSDLRLVDVEFLISFITLQMYNHVADHVASSAERYFSPGFITLGQGCNVSVKWHEPPEITIDLIMHLSWAKAYFSVVMRADNADVRLNYLALDGAGSDARENTARLRDAIRCNMIAPGAAR